LDILEETGLMNSKYFNTLMDPDAKLLPSQRASLSDPPEKYKRLVGKLNYLTVTRPDISFAISVVSQFLNSSILIIGMQSFVSTLKVFLEKVCYMVTITMLKLYVI